MSELLRDLPSSSHPDSYSSFTDLETSLVEGNGEGSHKPESPNKGAKTPNPETHSPSRKDLGKACLALKQRRRSGRKSMKRWQGKIRSKIIKSKVQATPQTLAKLQPAPWAVWGMELQRAAQEINLAFRLVAANGLVQARDWQPVMGPGIRPVDPHPLTPYAERLIKRFRRFAALLSPNDLSFVIDVVVQGENPASEAMSNRLQSCLEQYATGK